jgi:hypothetical protein
MRLNDIRHVPTLSPEDLQPLRKAYLNPFERASVRFRGPNPEVVHDPIDVTVIGVMMGYDDLNLLMYVTGDESGKPVHMKRIQYADIAWNIASYESEYTRTHPPEPKQGILSRLVSFAKPYLPELQFGYR